LRVASLPEPTATLAETRRIESPRSPLEPLLYRLIFIHALLGALAALLLGPLRDRSMARAGITA